MLDMKFLRQNPEAVKENIRKKFQEDKLPLVDEVLEMDKACREKKTRSDYLRSQRNAISKQIGAMMAKGQREEAEQTKRQVTDMAQEMEELGQQIGQLEEEIRKRMLVIPNLIDPAVPLGKDDSENVERQRFGEPRVPDYEVPYHVDIMEKLAGIDLDSARKTSGTGFYYLCGDVARLQSAVLSYARDFMIGKGFTYYIPPFMIRSSVVDGVMSFAEMENMMYKIEGEDLYLIGTSEHAMIGKFIDTILDESSLPQTLTSYSPCFRKEVGAHGIEERGVYRLQHGRRPSTPFGHPGAAKRRQLFPPHIEQHRGGPAPHAHRLFGKQSAGRWQCEDPASTAALYGRPGGHPSQSMI